jgi:phage gp45-like
MIRGIVKQVIEGVIKRFSAYGRTDETIDDREYFQHYGFTSRPKPDAELIIIQEDNHYVAIASDDRRYRIALEEGEVAIYTDEGDKIHLMRDKTIHIVSGNKLIADVTNEVDITTIKAVVTASESCQVNSPIINLGDDRGTVRYLVDQRLIDLFNNHTHAGVTIGTDSSAAAGQILSLNNVCTIKTKAD